MWPWFVLCLLAVPAHSKQKTSWSNPLLMTDNWEDLADKEITEWPSLKEAAKAPKPSPKPQPTASENSPWLASQTLKFMTPYEAQPVRILSRKKVGLLVIS